jgi:HEAT repeat protein
LVSAVAAAVPGAVALAQDVRVNGAASDQAADAARNELQQQRAALLGEASTEPQRIEAARRLLSQGDHPALLEAIGSGSPSRIIAVARAIENAANPPREYIAELVRQLGPGVARDVAEAVCRALANYKDDEAARDALAGFARQLNAAPANRLAAIKALGSFNDIGAARVLVEDLLRDETQGQVIRDAAADALRDMTGIADYGNDVGQWERWWQRERRLAPEQFRRARMEDKFGELRQKAAELEQLVKSVEASVVDFHRRLPDEPAREAYVLDTLKQDHAAFKRAGANLVILRKLNGQTIAEPVMAQLRNLIGDSSADVRLVAAQAIGKINDARAVKPILAQLQRERLPGVKAALIAALEPTQDVSAAPELLTQLRDPSLQVAQAAAVTLAAMGAEITKDGNLAAETAKALNEALARSVNAPGGQRFREAVVRALVPLRNSGMMRELAALLPERPENTPNVRIAAVRGLANLNLDARRKEDIALQVAAVLGRDSQAGVRLEAAQALAAVGGPAQGETLFKAINDDPDPNVRQEAWKSLSQLFDKFDSRTLSQWGLQRFNGQPDRKLAIYHALERRLAEEAQRNPNLGTELADARNTVGALYMDDKINEPEKAIPFLDQALRHYDTQPTTPPELQERLITAYLRARQYKEAMQFARGRFQRQEQNKDSMGQMIQREAERLIKEKRLEDALALLEEARALQIGGRYQDLFDRRASELREGKLPSLFDLFPAEFREVYA